MRKKYLKENIADIKMETYYYLFGGVILGYFTNKIGCYVHGFASSLYTTLHIRMQEISSDMNDRLTKMENILSSESKAREEYMNTINEKINQLNNQTRDLRDFKSIISSITQNTVDTTKGCYKTYAGMFVDEATEKLIRNLEDKMYPDMYTDTISPPVQNEERKQQIVTATVVPMKASETKQECHFNKIKCIPLNSEEKKD